MKNMLSIAALCIALLPSAAQAQDRAALQADFQLWLADDIWPRARAQGVSRATFDAALSGVQLNWDLPGLNIPGAPRQGQQSQAEFRPPANYFRSRVVTPAADTGRRMAQRHAGTLNRITQQTGVPGRIILAIWGRESSYGQAAIPHDAFEILGTNGFMGARAAYFTDELIAALKMVETGAAPRNQMRSSWAGALGQPQFMPSSYLAHAADGDGDGRADIWGSEPDTLASIGAYLQSYGWVAGRDWGFEVSVPANVPCTLNGPDNGRSIQDWRDMGITRVSGRPFPQAELPQDGFLLMPAGRYGPAFIVTPNFYVLKAYNESDAYALFVGHVGDRIQYGVSDFAGRWDPLDTLSRSRVRQMQQTLEGLGADVGGADGLIGFKTRRSVGLWQAQNGQAVTCYPNQATLAALLQ